MIADHFETGLAIIGNEKIAPHAEPPRNQSAREHNVVIAVVDQEHVCTPHAHARLTRPNDRLFSRTRAVHRHSARQREEEARTQADCGFAADCSAMRFDDLPADGKTKPTMRIFSVEAAEWLEDLALMFDGDARTIGAHNH